MNSDNDNARLTVLEDKIDFVMKSFTVVRKEGILNPIMIQESLFDLYARVKASSPLVGEVKEGEVLNGTDR